MTNIRATTKQGLLADIERAWLALHAALGRLSEEQLSDARDAAGWSVKDHVAHLAAWERSAAYFLRGRPRHEGLGVEERAYLGGKDDDINAVIYERTQGLAPAEALAELEDAHRELLAALEPLSDDDLRKTYRHYLPDEPGEGDGPLALSVVYGNSAEHYTEHLGWIQTLVGKAGVSP